MANIPCPTHELACKHSGGGTDPPHQSLQPCNRQPPWKPHLRRSAIPSSLQLELVKSGLILSRDGQTTNKPLIWRVTMWSSSFLNVVMRPSEKHLIWTFGALSEQFPITLSPWLFIKKTSRLLMYSYKRCARTRMNSSRPSLRIIENSQLFASSRWNARWRPAMPWLITMTS